MLKFGGEAGPAGALKLNIAKADLRTLRRP